MTTRRPAGLYDITEGPHAGKKGIEQLPDGDKLAEDLLPARVSAPEIAAGAETGLRSFAPADVAAMVAAHAPTSIATGYLRVTGNGLKIPDGDLSPQVADGTDFGQIQLGQSVDHTFTVRNVGAADVALTGVSPVSVSTGDYSVTAQPSVGVLQPEEQTTFSLRAAPIAAGVRSAIVQIASDDPVRAPYDFAVTCGGISTIRGASAGGAGFGIAAPSSLPAGFEVVSASGYQDRNHAQFGQVRHILSGALGTLLGKAYRKIHADNTHEIRYADEFPGGSVEANAAGFGLMRAFYAGGTEGAPTEQSVLFLDRFLSSKKAQGAGFVTTSVANARALATANRAFSDSTTEGVGQITACGGVNAYYAALRAAKGRDDPNGAYNPASPWFSPPLYIYNLLASLSLAHGQAATSTANCAWYDPTGVRNYPAACSNNALGDAQFPGLLYTHDGYVSGNSPLTGSANNFAMTTHNGQMNGIPIQEGFWQVAIGMTRGSDQGTTNVFYSLKPHIHPKDLDWGQGASPNAWGTMAQLAAQYDAVSVPQLTGGGAWRYLGNGANHVFSGDVSGDGYILDSLGIPMAGGFGASGQNRFGGDAIFDAYAGLLCPLACAYWGNGSVAGAWTAYLGIARAASGIDVGFRAACYFGA